MKYKRSKNISISVYLVTLIIGAIIVVVFLLTMAFYQIFQSSLLSVAQTNTEQSVTQVSNTMNNYSNNILKKMDNMTSLISHDQEPNSISEHMTTMIDINDDIASIIIYDLDGNILDYKAASSLKKDIGNNLSFNKEMFSANSEYYITSPHVQNIFEDGYPWVVTISQKKWAGSYGGEVYITMDIKFSSMATYIDDVGIGQHGYCFITNSRNDIVYHPLQQLIYLGIKQEDIATINQYGLGSTVVDGTIYSINNIEDSNWKIVGVSFTSELVDSKVLTAIQIIGWILIITLVFASVIVFKVSKKLTKPIRSLVDAMNEFEQNAIDFKYDSIRGVSEFNNLSHSFEHMVIQVQELMEKVKNEEITLRKTELKALQAQINPHFLYNTLDSIQWMCEENKTEDAITMVGALAQLFRISISKGYELITIEKEIQHAKNYLVIQNYRYKGQFTYCFDIDEEVLQYLCNKITLQPIIENALHHGISRMVDEGQITITAKKQETAIVFTICDNGVGMSEEQVTNILKKELTDSKGIGVKNVNDRIKIYFGEEYGIVVESELDKGTTISIKIPAIMEADYVQ